MAPPSLLLSSHAVTRRGIGRHERGANLRALKRAIPHLSRAATDRRVPAVCLPYESPNLSSSMPQTEVSSRRAPMRIPRAWIKGRALGWLVLIYPRASVFPLLLFRRFSWTPPRPPFVSPIQPSRGVWYLQEMPSSTYLPFLSLVPLFLLSLLAPPRPRRYPLVIIPREVGASSLTNALFSVCRERAVILQDLTTWRPLV